MELQWFVDYLNEQLPGMVGGTKLEAEGPALLLATSERNCGRIFGTHAAIDDSARRRHAVAAAAEVMQAWFAQSWPPAKPATGSYYALPAASPGAGSAGGLVALHRLALKVSLNTGSRAELEALPGLGSVTARAIITHRERCGPFLSVDDVCRVAGITTAAFAKFAALVNVDANASAVEGPEFARFLKERSLASFATWCQQSGNVPVADKVLDVLRRASAWAGTSPFEPMRNRRATAVDDAVRRHDRVALAAAATGLAARDVAVGALVFDLAYLGFVTRLIEQAQKSIQLVMFFVRYKDEVRCPIDALVQALIAARKRGVDVKVLLDKDRETDVYGSHIINKDAFDKLSAAGVNVRYDSPERLTHTKLITVDDRHTVLGSHNWTAGSMYAYDDTSLYLESRALAAHYGRDFQARFDRVLT